MNQLCFCSVARSCPTLCNAINCSTPGFTVLWSLLKLTSIESDAWWCIQPYIMASIDDAMQPSSVTPFSCCQSFQHWNLFQWVSSPHQMAKVLEFNFRLGPYSEFSELISFRLTSLISLLSKGLSRVFSSTTVQKHQFFVSQMVKNVPAMWETWVGKIPWRTAWQSTPVHLSGECLWTEEPGELQSMSSQTVRHDWAVKHNTSTAFFVVQLSHLHMTTRKTIALTMWTFAGKVMILLNYQ